MNIYVGDDINKGNVVVVCHSKTDWDAAIDRLSEKTTFDYKTVYNSSYGGVYAFSARSGKFDGHCWGDGTQEKKVIEIIGLYTSIIKPKKHLCKKYQR